jgi:hypothetical protein
MADLENPARKIEQNTLHKIEKIIFSWYVK